MTFTTFGSNYCHEQFARKSITDLILNKVKYGSLHFTFAYNWIEIGHLLESKFKSKTGNYEEECRIFSKWTQMRMKSVGVKEVPQEIEALEHLQLLTDTPSNQTKLSWTKSHWKIKILFTEKPNQEINKKHTCINYIYLNKKKSN